MAEMIKVTVHDREIEIRDDWRDDYETVVLIGQMDRGNILATPPLFERLVGDNAEEVLEDLRDDDGIIRVTTVSAWILDLIKACNAKN